MLRRLRVEQDAQGALVPTMWGMPSKRYSYLPYGVSPPDVMNGRFATGEGMPPDVEWIASSMAYPREGFILEYARGLDSGLHVLWDAYVGWDRI